MNSPEHDEDYSIDSPEKTVRPPMLRPGQIFLVLLVIAVITEVAAVVSYQIRPYSGDYDTEDYFAGADASERGGMQYLTDEEVKDAGLACTELGHFDFSGESLLDDVSAILKDQGLDVAGTDTSSFNQIYGDGGSWYETLQTLSLDVPGDDTGYQRLMLNYDTATGALHEIDLFISDEERLTGLTTALMELLNDRSGGGIISSEEEIRDTLHRYLERGENLYAVYGTEETGYITLTLYCFEDGYSVFIGRE